MDALDTKDFAKEERKINVKSEEENVKQEIDPQLKDPPFLESQVNIKSESSSIQFNDDSNEQNEESNLKPYKEGIKQEFDAQFDNDIIPTDCRADVKEEASSSEDFDNSAPPSALKRPSMSTLEHIGKRKKEIADHFQAMTSLWEKKLAVRKKIHELEIQKLNDSITHQRKLHEMKMRHREQKHKLETQKLEMEEKIFSNRSGRGNKRD